LSITKPALCGCVGAPAALNGGHHRGSPRPFPRTPRAVSLPYAWPGAAGARRAASTPTSRRSMINIDRVDHLVLTVADVDRAVQFYEQILGMTPVTFPGERRAVRF